ncbi:membrane protein [soil metagenome]
MSAPTSDRKATGVFSPTRAQIPQRTLRTDAWWKSPLITDLGFAAFVIYATVRAFQRDHFFVEKYHYLTPFYSPCLSKACGDASDFWPQILPTTGLLSLIPYAFLSLPFLLLFRLTCYYYRGAYYRSVWQSPTACAVAEPHAKYTGETRLPLVIQNTHRYFFYIAGVISIINTYDAIVAFQSADGPGGFGFGLGNIILVGNVVMLWVYTISCHSCRHAVGGKLKHFSKHPVRYWMWTQVSRLNTRHKLYAWITLGTLMFTDFYVMMVSITGWDLRFVG